MTTLIVKEIRSFLGSLIGHIVLIVFLILTGLFLWVFPENILELGYADLGPFFFIAPWIFLFLIPAVTMRSFSEEKRTGTIELLLTRPLSELQIVFAKFFASWTLVLFALIPTLFYLYSISQLAAPVGNVDLGGVWGSYIGLLLLGGSFCSIGVFASSITENQVIAFIVAVFLCFFMYTGFDLIATFSAFGGLEGPLRGLGMQEHYRSLSRGVIDVRDAMYFIGLMAAFLMLTRTVIQSRKW